MSKEGRSAPSIPVPQYPFEMYAFGELYAENGKYMKRRGPRTTIKQQQVIELEALISQNIIWNGNLAWQTEAKYLSRISHSGMRHILAHSFQIDALRA